MLTKTDIYEFEPIEGTTLYADPLMLRRRLLQETHGRCMEWAKRAKTLQSDIDAIGDGDDEESKAKRAEWSRQLADLDGHLANATFEAFGFERVDPSTGFGMTELGALEVLYAFLEWLEKKDERLDGSQT